MRRPAADSLLLSFDATAPEGVERVGRTHVLTEALADYLLGSALTPQEDKPPASRSGLIRTRAVTTRTTLLLLRVRMLIESGRQRTGTLAEELVVVGYTGRPGAAVWLDQAAALALLETARPDQAVPPEERALGLRRAGEQVAALQADLDAVAQARAKRLEEAHHRVRQATGRGKATVRPHLPADVLGVYVLLPLV